MGLFCGARSSFAWGAGAIALLAVSVASCLGGGGSGGGVQQVGTWAAALSVAPAWSGSALASSSSSRLAVSWAAAPPPVDHYELVLREVASTVTVVVSGATTTAAVSDLKSGTAYSISVRAYPDASGAAFLAGGGAPAVSTAEEVWQLQGTGHGFSSMTRIVTEANNIPYVIRYGAEAGAVLSGRYRLYFHPWRRVGHSVEMATAIAGSSGPLADLQSFSAEGGYGLQQTISGATWVSAIATFQAVPLSVAMGGRIRLFFEAEGDDRKVRLFSVDSRDGYAGLDFDPGASTVCDRFEPGDPCAADVVLGVEGDTVLGDTGLTMARQSKVGYPKRSSWLWDGAPGAFMVITGADGCGQTSDGLFYALWDGSRFHVVQDAGGCARPLVLQAHGPVVVHLGAGRYKLYYEDRVGGSFMDKPLHLLYGDSARGGDPAVVEYEDWESAADAREVHFLWPDGTAVSDANESGLGDHMILLPTGSPDLQVMVCNLGGMDDSSNPQSSQGIGAAVLLNP